MPTTRSINDLYYVSDGIDCGVDVWGQTLQGALVNPAHSALRRVRHFSRAQGYIMGRSRYSANVSMDAIRGYMQAEARQLWSVR